MEGHRACTAGDLAGHCLQPQATLLNKLAQSAPVSINGSLETICYAAGSASQPSDRPAMLQLGREAASCFERGGSGVQALPICPHNSIYEQDAL